MRLDQRRLAWRVRRHLTRVDVDLFRQRLPALGHRHYLTLGHENPLISLSAAYRAASTAIGW